MRVVLDTNILISACWKPGGLEDRTVQLASSGAVELCVSTVIWAEYAEVFSRSKFSRFQEHAARLLCGLHARARFVEPAFALNGASDEDDNRLLECAAAADASYLVTGNLKHFPTASGRTQIVNARQFLQREFPAG